MKPQSQPPYMAQMSVMSCDDTDLCGTDLTLGKFIYFSFSLWS